MNIVNTRESNVVDGFVGVLVYFDVVNYGGKETNPESKHFGDLIDVFTIRRSTSQSASPTSQSLYLCSPDGRTLVVQVSDSTDERSNHSKTFSNQFIVILNF